MPATSRAFTRNVTWLFVAVVLVKAAAYWIGSAVLRPDDPFSTIVLYRGKDIESFPIMKVLAHLGFGEAGLFERFNQGVLTERFVPWLLHAFFFGTLGSVGFVVVDLLVTPVYFLLFRALLTRCGVSRIAATVGAAVVTCAAINDFGDLFTWFSVFPRFWGLRLPRPFISELFLLAAFLGLVVALRGVSERRVPRWAWIAAGGGLGLLAQSDLYSATAIGLGAVGVLIAVLFTIDGAGRAMLFRGCVTAGIAGTVASLPGIVQSLFVNPEAIVRLGLFPASRLRPPFIDAPSWYAGTAILFVAGRVLTRMARAATLPASEDQRAGRVVVLAACVGALAAMPVTAVLLGKSIELYHYRDTFVRMFSLALLVVGLQAVSVVWHVGVARLGERLTRLDALLVRAVVVSGTLLCLGLAWRHATAGPAQSDHMRSDFAEWAALPDYRRHFVELARELEKDLYGGGRVLGTFDHQVWAWWVTFRDGYSYLGDACTTNVENAELEQRAAELSRVVGMDRDRFLTFIRRRYVMVFWMSCSKYQATRVYSFAPLSDYTESDRRLIATTPGYLGFTVALPLSQQARIGDLFARLPGSPSHRLDVVVLTKDESVAGRSPPGSEFDLTFENELFAVWLRRKGGRSR